jgi:hypothetical protein
VDVRDPPGGPVQQLQRLHAADEQVPGVEAEQHLAAVQQAQHRVPVLDGGTHVRVQRGRQTVRTGGAL